MSKILITSALPYVNGVPHLGHLVGCLLPSDGEHSSITLVFRRHLNYYKKGYKTYFFILL